MGSEKAWLLGLEHTATEDVRPSLATVGTSVVPDGLSREYEILPARPHRIRDPSGYREGWSSCCT